MPLPGRAEVEEDARRTVRPSSGTGRPTMEDQSQAHRSPDDLSEEGVQAMLHLHGVTRSRQVEAFREPQDVGIDGETGKTEGNGPHDVRRLATNSRQRDEIFSTTRHDPVIDRDQPVGEPEEVICLRSVEARREDQPLERRSVSTSERFGRRIRREQRRSGGVHPDVGALCRQHGRDEELEGRVEIEFAQFSGCPWEALLEAIGNGSSAFFGGRSSRHGRSVPGGTVGAVGSLRPWST